VYVFNAERRSCRIIVAPPPFKNPWDTTQPDDRECAITPDFTKYLHTLDADKANTYLACQALIANTPSSDPQESSPPPASWARVVGGDLVLTPAGSGPLEEVSITGTDGRLLRAVPGPLVQRPIRVGLQGIPSGMYFCTIRWQGEVMTASFTITK
jgi:hypothetical protein